MHRIECSSVCVCWNVHLTVFQFSFRLLLWFDAFVLNPRNVFQKEKKIIEKCNIFCIRRSPHISLKHMSDTICMEIPSNKICSTQMPVCQLVLGEIRTNCARRHAVVDIASHSTVNGMLLVLCRSKQFQLKFSIWYFHKVEHHSKHTTQCVTVSLTSQSRVEEWCECVLTVEILTQIHAHTPFHTRVSMAL